MLTPDELIERLAIERLSGEGRTEIMSGELPHGCKGWSYGYLVGDDLWIDEYSGPDMSRTTGGHRSYTWEAVKQGDKIIFWTGRNKGKIFEIISNYKHYTDHWLVLTDNIYNPRKGDKYTIFREAKHGSTR